MSDDQTLEMLDGGSNEAPPPSTYADPGEDANAGIGKWKIWRRISLRRTPIQNFDQATAAHDLKERRSNLNFRRVYASILLAAMVVQVGIADFFFWRYLQAYDFLVPEQTMSVWIGAAVVQVIGLVAIITKYLFNGNGD